MVEGTRLRRASVSGWAGWKLMCQFRLPGLFQASGGVACRVAGISACRQQALPASVGFGTHSYIYSLQLPATCPSHLIQSAPSHLHSHALQTLA